MVRRVALLSMLAGCGQVIGIRELGVEPSPSALPVDSGSPSPTEPDDAANDGPSEAKVEAGVDADGCAVPAVAGKWTGIFTAADGSVFAGGVKTAPGDLELEQNCTLVTGSLTVGSCFVTMKVLATLDESGALAGTASYSGISLSLSATLSFPKRFVGTFQVMPSGTCGVKSGTFQIVGE